MILVSDFDAAFRILYSVFLYSCIPVCCIIPDRLQGSSKKKSYHWHTINSRAQTMPIAFCVASVLSVLSVLCVTVILAIYAYPSVNSLPTGPASSVCCFPLHHCAVLRHCQFWYTREPHLPRPIQLWCDVHFPVVQSTSLPSNFQPGTVRIAQDTVGVASRSKQPAPVANRPPSLSRCACRLRPLRLITTFERNASRTYHTCTQDIPVHTAARLPRTYCTVPRALQTLVNSDYFRSSDPERAQCAPDQGSFANLFVT